MRFYVLSQSQIVMASVAATVALLALIWLLVFAWRTLRETVEKTNVDDAELVCRYCKAKAVHASFRAGFFDNVFWLFSYLPYRCGVCSWRFYVHRPHSANRAATQAH